MKDPVHEVTISKPFHMGIYEVTQKQYEAVMGKNPSHFPEAAKPVETVTWEDAAEFCRKLSQKTGQTVRLPTEAEWEYACRAGSTTRFCFGDDDKEAGQVRLVDARTARRPRIPWGRRRPTPGACMTCTAMSGSGAQTGMRDRTREVPRSIPRDLRRVRPAW